MQAVAKHHSTVIKDYFAYLFRPEPLWRQLYLMVMNERETYLRYPQEAFRYWLRHDSWRVSSIQTKPKPMIQWQNCVFRDRKLSYDDIPLLGDLEYKFLCDRRRKTALQSLQVKKYECVSLFTNCDASAWKLYNEHPSWVANTILERFGDIDCVLKRRMGRLIQTQTNTEWTDMLGARLVIVRQLTRLLGLTELWNANGKLVGPGQYRKAQRFVERNQDKVKLAFGNKTLKGILNSWAGHRLTVHTRRRGRPSMLELPVSKTDRRAILQKVYAFWKAENRVDPIFQIKSHPWNLRHPRTLFFQ